MTTPFTFIDLFAGIGGIRRGFEQHGGQCVFSSEWDKFAQNTYRANYHDEPHGDITQIPAWAIPDHDVLLAGFPCQTFSLAGLQRGFDDTRGTMFFEIQRVLAEKRPKMFLLENVKQLRSHNKGKTFQVMRDVLTGNTQSAIPKGIELSTDTRNALSERLHYDIDYTVLDAKQFGLPQNRQRLFIVGIDRAQTPDWCGLSTFFEWPTPSHTPVRLGDILEDNLFVDPKYTVTEKVWKCLVDRKALAQSRGNGFGYTLFNRTSTHANTMSARYHKDGSEILIDQSDLGKRPRRLTPRECARLQGFPETFDLSASSDTQLYRQFGNSVAVSVVSAVAEQLVKALRLSTIYEPF